MFYIQSGAIIQKNENKLYIWAESSALFSTDPKARKSKLHPFAASKDDLIEVVESKKEELGGRAWGGKQKYLVAYTGS